MKKEHLIFAVSTLLSLLVAVVIVRSIRPDFFGTTRDMQVVQLSNELPAFYEAVFSSASDSSETDMLLNDPMTLVRGAPFFTNRMALGPHDALGFRNDGVPNMADIVTIGDSQTYGNNVIMRENWPSIMAQYVPQSPVVYNMSLGSWGALQYLDMAKKSIRFNPKLIIMAIYTGNDALETFKTAYAVDAWKKFRTDTNVSISDMPAIPFPPRAEDTWKFSFKDGTSTIFTPKHRLLSNDSTSAAVRQGYNIIKAVLSETAELAAHNKVALALTIIPSKELVYASRVLQEAGSLTADYKRLFDEERQFITSLQEHMRSLPEVTVIDVIEPLIKNAATAMIYPHDANGHPHSVGYAIIGRAVAQEVASIVGKIRLRLDSGVYRVTQAGGREWFYLLREGKLLLFPFLQMGLDNGWRESDFAAVSQQQIDRQPLVGVIREVNPVLYGPEE